MWGKKLPKKGSYFSKEATIINESILMKQAPKNPKDTGKQVINSAELILDISNF